jgi:uncharacterized protein YecE (DUF72 family)
MTGAATESRQGSGLASQSLRTGTSGFSYAEWKGSFYPEKLPAKRMLTYYAERFPAVEINNTFYRMPSAKLLDGWIEQVPETFEFSLKASRKITHFKKLREVEEELTYFLEVSNRLGSRLGPFLFQLPPYLKKDIELLRDFVKLLPAGTRAGFEFRSSSWFDDAVYTILADADLALVVSDTEKIEDPPVVRTSSYGYARLRREEYDGPGLESWIEKLSAQEWEQLSVFFKHEDAGTGPRLALRFAELWPT